MIPHALGSLLDFWVRVRSDLVHAESNGVILSEPSPRRFSGVPWLA